MSDDEKIARLNIKFKSPPDDSEPMLKVVGGQEGCNHRYYYTSDGGAVLGGTMRDVQYLIREGETEVECGHCHTKLDPMFVLKILAHEENKWGNSRSRYQDEMKRLGERRRTQCDHCGKMTRISRR